MRFFGYIVDFFCKKRSFCPVCGKVNAGFDPLPDFYANNAKKNGYIHFGKGEMTPLETYSCSNCGASDRERLYAYWIESCPKHKILTSNIRIIHFAPETNLSLKLKNLLGERYQSADLVMHDCDFMVNIMCMPFKDESYDFFICSHVLEHVESDDNAISELYRITKKGGCGILMAPIVVGLENTIEDPAVTDEAERWRLFGQNDHVRLYAHSDYVSKIRKHGFRVQELDENHFGKKIFLQMGLKRTSILYIVEK